MDQTSYWMWSRRQWSGGAPLNFLPSTAPAGYPYYESWEERAFAEDSAGLLGAGCVWPPRSYSCSFCRREFRSAQALGGHMNVHRRDRARLKQSSSSDRENNDYEHHLNPQVATLVLPNPNPIPNPNTNPNPSNDHVASNLSSPSKNSAVSAHDNCSENTLLSASCSSNIIQERLKEPLFSTIGSRLEPILIRELDDLDLKLGGMTRKAMEACSQESENRGGDDDEANRSKRRRTCMLLPSQMVPTCSRNQQKVQSELLQPTGEMDLELRLGYGPKI